MTGIVSTMPAHFKTKMTGEVSGSATAKQLPMLPCSLVNIKAVASNEGNVYVGFKSSVSLPDGTTDHSTGFPLDASEETGWITVTNLNEIYIICDNAGDDIIFFAMQ